MNLTMEKTTPKTIETPVYQYEEVLQNCLTYFDGDELAATTWINKYCMKNVKGELLELTPDDMHKRMAKEFARIEKKYAGKYKMNGSAPNFSG